MEGVLESQLQTGKEGKEDLYKSFLERYPDIVFLGFAGDVDKLPPDSQTSLPMRIVSGYPLRPIFTDNFPDHISRRTFRETLPPEDREIYDRNALRVNNITSALSAIQILCMDSPELSRVYSNCTRRFKSPDYYAAIDIKSKVSFVKYLARQCARFAASSK